MDNFFIDRLEEIRAGRSKSALGREWGVSEGGIRQYLSGNSEPTRPKLIQIAEGSGVCLEWLATGRGPKYRSVEAAAPAVAEPESPYLTAAKHNGARDWINEWLDEVFQDQNQGMILYEEMKDAFQEFAAFCEKKGKGRYHLDAAVQEQNRNIG